MAAEDYSIICDTKKRTCLGRVASIKQLAAAEDVITRSETSKASLWTHISAMSPFVSEVALKMVRAPSPEQVEQAQRAIFNAEARLELNCNDATRCIQQSAISADQSAQRLTAAA